MSDSGGGGAIQHTHLALIRNGVIPKESKKNHCDMHGNNNTLEQGLVKALGISGIGQKTPPHMLFLYESLLDCCQEEFGRKAKLDKI